MFLPQPLPRTLFEEIGKIVVIWAAIEQAIVLHASAMAAQKTEGRTTDWLRMEFRRLRETWFKLCRECFDTKALDKVITPLNMELARLSEQRGYIVHGSWYPDGRGKFKLICFEQKGQLARYETDVTLRMLREIRHDSFLLSKRVDRFVRGKDSLGDGPRARLKVVGPIVPRDQRQSPSL